MARSAVLPALAASLVLASCMTFNHGEAPEKGRLELSVDSAMTQWLPSRSEGNPVLPIIPQTRVGLAYGVSDGFGMGFSVDGASTAALGLRSGALAAVSPFVEWAWRSSTGTAVFTLEADVITDFNLYVVPLPSLSWAYSWKVNGLRPFVGTFLAAEFVQIYGGIEIVEGHWRPSLTVGGTATVSVMGLFVDPGLTYCY